MGSIFDPIKFIFKLKRRLLLLLLSFFYFESLNPKITHRIEHKIPDVLESISNTSIHRYNGALTKFNRTNRSYPKDHWIDASQVGYSSSIFKDCYLEVEATGRGSRQMCRVDKYGFPRTSAKKNKRVHGFQTGDIVKAIVTNGKHIGKYIGRVSIRSSGSFNIKDINLNRTIQGISWQYCKTISQMNGYNFKLSSTV